MICVSYYEAMKRHSKFISSAGNGFVDVYELKKDSKNGNEVLVKTGKKNLEEEIQAYGPSTEISNIIQRFVNGETDLLNQVSGFYGDVTDAPKSYAEYFAKVKEAEKIFSNLPDDIKVKFDNDPEKFFLEFGTESFNNKFSDSVFNENMSEFQEEFDNAE